MLAAVGALRFCAARCEDTNPATTAYPCEPFREGYVFPLALPEPQPGLCGDMGVRPPTIGYQFQVKIMFKGWCRVRGLLVHALPKMNRSIRASAVLRGEKIGGMATLPFVPSPSDFTPPRCPRLCPLRLRLRHPNRLILLIP